MFLLFMFFFQNDSTEFRRSETVNTEKIEKKAKMRRRIIFSLVSLFTIFSLVFIHLSAILSRFIRIFANFLQMLFAFLRASCAFLSSDFYFEERFLSCSEVLLSSSLISVPEKSTRPSSGS